MGPARAAWEARLADEFGITDELTAVERSKRLDFAMRVRMTELARTRWTKRGSAVIETPAEPETTGGTSDAASSS